MFRRDRENTYLIVITKPEEDRGKGYLKSGNNLWFYDPVSRRFTFTSAKDRFQNMNARNSDFTRSNLARRLQGRRIAEGQAGHLRLLAPGPRCNQRRHHLSENEDLDQR